MKITKCYLLIILMCSLNINGFITNASDAGYLGDRLINYIKAQYLSHKYKIPFKLRPLGYSTEALTLHNHDPIATFSKPIIRVTDESQLINAHPSYIYNVSYYCKIQGCTSLYDINTWHSILNDKVFIRKIKKLIAKKEDIKLDIPQDVMAIAIHVRKPLDADYPLKSCQFYNSSKLHNKRSHQEFKNNCNPIMRTLYSDIGNPEKFVPDQFYIDQLKRIRSLFPHKKIVVYLFTNYHHGSQLCSLYRKKLNDNNLSFVIDNSSYTHRLIDDIINMSKFDYLIRSRSNYSQIADFIGNHKLVISPQTLAWYKNEHGQDCLVVEKVIIKTNEKGKCHFEICDNI